MNNSLLSVPVDRGNALVRVADVWKSYENGAIQVLNGVTLEVYEGETVALCGPSGCGKSTLLHLLGGLDEPDRGTVLVRGKRPSDRKESLRILRHEVGFVFQLHNLIPDLTLQENCLIPAVASGVPGEAALTRVRQLAEKTGLSHRLHQKVQKLSGGERQRTALCRALMNHPAILLADEPTGSLDESTSRQIFDLLIDVAETEGVTLVMATHDRQLAHLCHRMVEMRDGKICEPVLS